jgi:DNA topoisomerase-3
MLEEISKGKISKADFLEKQTAMIREFVQSDLAEPFKANGPVHSCPQCKDGQLRKRSGTSGAFWGCNKYPECKSTFPDANGSPNLSAKPKAPVSEIEKCKTCGKGLVRRTGPRGFFWGCSGYPSCKSSYQDQAGKPQYA